MKYSRTLDFVLAALSKAKEGKVEAAAVCFEKAMKQKDLNETVSALEDMQVAAFEELSKQKPAIRTLFAQLLTKQTAKTDAAKAGAGKKEPKKAEKAGNDDDLPTVLDDMTAAEDDGEGADNGDLDDLTIEDLEDLDDDDGDVIEMPEASTASDDSDDADDEKEDDEGKEEDSKKTKAKATKAEAEDDKDDEEDADDDKEDKGDKEEDPKKSAKASTVKANLAALDRLAKTRKTAKK